jgi:hypothetical protein
MRLRGCTSLAEMFIVAILVAGSSGCSGGSATTPPPPGHAISVSLSETRATVDEGATAQFAAMVTNDSANVGVTWTVSCSAAPCGSVSPNSTASGATTTYTPPRSLVNDLTVTLTAASLADATKSASLTITIPAITLSLAPTSANVQAGAKAQLTATVTNDGGNNGVNWTISCSAAPCGSVSPTATANGSATTYTAPASPPPSLLTVTLTATSVSDGTKTASATVTVPVVTVSVIPSAATVKVGASAQFSAAVTNDVASNGVIWSVSCSSSSCGSVSPKATASGADTTYTAPSTQIVGNLTVTLTATSVTDPAASASATITVSGITVSIAPTSASVPSGGTQQFTATVSNDPNNGGVTWQLLAELACFDPQGRSCHVASPVFVACITCGTVSPTSSATGAPVTYTAPAHFTRPLFPSGYNFFVGIFLQATSATNTAALGRASVRILPISVSVSPGTANVSINGTQQLTATVTNDGTNSGVTWTVTQNGVACAPGCGNIAPMSTASGANVTYTAPAVAPTLPVVAVIAKSVEDSAASASAIVTITGSGGGPACGAGSGSESLLNGQYAFLLHGFDSNGDVATVGSFTADGTGKITAGEEDIHRSPGLETDLSIGATASSYAVGSDHRGCVILANSNGETTYLRFALGSTNSGGIATLGHIIEFDDMAGTGTRATGTIRLQDATAFAASHFNGNYTFGVAGGFNGRFALAGTLTSDGVSALTTSSFDVDTAGTITSNASSSPGGVFTCCSANGRGTLQISASALTVDFWVYMINSGDAFVVSTDVAVASGEAIGVPSTATFTQASLNGISVLRGTAQSASGPIVDIATANADGKGSLTVNDNVNNAGTFTTGSSLLNYVVASNGRVMTTGGSTPPVLYLYGQNQGFLVGTDPDVTFGIVEPQAAGPFSDASLSGAYMDGTENPSASTVTMESAAVTPDGSGNATGTSDQSSSAGLAQNQPGSLTYSIAADGTGTFGSNTTAILVSGNKLVFISNTSANPTITVVEK